MIYEIISDNALFIETAAGLLEEKSGAKVYIRPGFMSGEEGGAAHFIDSLREIKKEYSKDFIFIAGGEIPVAAENKTGRGGRCQHFALEAMMRLKRDNLYGFKKITLAAFATDGLEAFTDAAGAVFDESDIRAASLDEIESSLRAADSYAYFQKNGGLIITGATGLNVNDAFMAFCF
jgi:hydroxypyruvate reductase